MGLESGPNQRKSSRTGISIKLIVIIGLFILLCQTNLPSLASQELTVQPESLRAIPKELQASLIDRLRAFIVAQKNNHWDQVSALLGKVRKGGYRDSVYTTSHKQCYIEQIKSPERVNDFETPLI
jgi:hypothetical protein